MRIGLVAEYVDRRKGGAETSVGEYAAHVAAAGIDVVCLTSGGECAARKRGRGTAHRGGDGTPVVAIQAIPGEGEYRGADGGI